MVRFKMNLSTKYHPKSQFAQFQYFNYQPWYEQNNPLKFSFIYVCLKYFLINFIGLKQKIHQIKS